MYKTWRCLRLGSETVCGRPRDPAVYTTLVKTSHEYTLTFLLLWTTFINKKKSRTE